MTGAARGIGAATALLFAREGARVVLNDINSEAVEAVRRQIVRSGGEAVAVAGDASSTTVARRLVATTLSAFGALHVLVNNAGISGSSAGDGPVTMSSEKAWDTVLRVNLKSVYLCSRFAIPEVIRGGGGSVVNLSSVLAMSGAAEHFQSHAYVASKGAILSLTRAMAAHYADRRVRVNAICPGLIETPMTANLRKNSALLRYIAGKQRLVGGLGTAEAVAEAVLFLASDASSLITGTVLPVDAGWTSGY